MDVLKTHNLIVEGDLDIILKTTPKINAKLRSEVGAAKLEYSLYNYHVATIMQACAAGRLVTEFIEHFGINRGNRGLMGQILKAIITSPNYNTSMLFQFLIICPAVDYDSDVIEWCCKNHICLLTTICKRMDITRLQIAHAIKSIKTHGFAPPIFYECIASLDPPTVLAELMYCFNTDPFAIVQRDKYMSALAATAALVNKLDYLQDYVVFCYKNGEITEAIKIMDKHGYPSRYVEHNYDLYNMYVENSKNPSKYRVIVDFALSPKEAIELLKHHEFTTTVSEKETILTIANYIKHFKTIDGLEQFFKSGHDLFVQQCATIIGKEDFALLFGLCIALRLPNMYEIVHTFVAEGHKDVINQWIACCDDEIEFAKYLKKYPKEGAILLYKTHVAWIVGNKKAQINLARMKSKLHCELFMAARRGKPPT